jgi:signal transduction histidine kinase
VTMLEAGDAAGDEVELRGHVQSLRHSMNVMVGITSDFLDLHAMSTGRLKLEEGWTNLRELLIGCVEMSLGRVTLLSRVGCNGARRCASHSMRPASVLVAVDSSVPPLVLLDPLRVRQVIMNGLTNAAK